MPSHSSEDWQRFAEATGYAPRFVQRRVVELAGLVLHAMADTASTLVEQGAGQARIEKARAAITHNAQRLLASLQA